MRCRFADLLLSLRITHGDHKCKADASYIRTDLLVDAHGNRAPAGIQSRDFASLPFHLSEGRIIRKAFQGLTDSSSRPI
jgi:hypothetical protein